MTNEWAAALRLLPGYLAQHVILSACALSLALAIGAPLAALCAHSARVRAPTLAFASVLQTAPGLALMALFYPLLLGVSTLTRATFGFATPALGFLPALLALTLYGLLPIVRNGVAALRGVDAAAIEAAKGVGMTARQQFFKVEAPLAAPVFMAGVRTAATWTIGAATLATPVGEPSLGNYIFTGLQTENWVYVLFGCAVAALLALAVDGLLAAMERGAARRNLPLMAAAGATLIFGVAAAFYSQSSGRSTTYVIGAKNFSEQFILADLMAQRLRAEGARVRVAQGLGSAIVFQALANNEIDAYVDYSGTLWTNVMKRRDRPGRAAMEAAIASYMRRRYGVRVLGRLGFQNAYVLAMRASRARALGVASIADLAKVAPRLKLGADLEFLARPEWAALRKAYGLTFKTALSFEPTFMYRALESGEVDVITAFSSDGRITADRLTVLTDPRRALPRYDALILLAPDRAHDARLIAALSPLIDKIDVCMMRRANTMADRRTDKAPPAAAARALAKWIAREPQGVDRAHGCG